MLLKLPKGAGSGGNGSFFVCQMTALHGVFVTEVGVDMDLKGHPGYDG